MDLTKVSSRLARCGMLAALTLCAVVQPVNAQKAPPAGKQKKVKDPLDSAKVEKGKREAESLVLFKSTDPVSFTLVADYKTVMKDRDTLSTKQYPGTLILRDSAGAEKKVPVLLRPRGHFRRASRNCDFMPLRLDFEKKDVKGTVFEGQDKFKLGTHCRASPEYEQYVLREYLAYKVHNLVSDRSFRARLAKVTYNDSVTGKTIGEHNALVFENEDDVARRMEGQVAELRGALFDDVDASQMDQVSVFEYFIGNTDWSLYALHNIRIVRRLDGTLLPLAYDLDFSGLVNTRYATPAEQLQLRTVKDRLYRGPCRPIASFDAALAVYRQKQADILAVYDFPGLDAGYARDAKAFLGDFFKMLQKPRDVKATFVDSCTGKPSV
jgi:hypothetical protein